MCYSVRMAASINTFNLSVKGHVTRRHDKDSDVTTFVVDQAQIEELHDATGRVLEFFGRGES